MNIFPAKSIYQELLLFILILIICGLLPLTGFQFYEHGTNSGSIAILKGVFSTVPMRLSNNDGNWILIHYLFRFFYTRFPNIDWYGITIVFSCALSIFLYIQIAKWAYARNKNRILLIILILIFVLLFENILILDFTHVAFLLSFLGLLIILCYLTSLQAGLNNFKFFLLGVFAFMLGSLIRHQPGILSFIIVLPVAAIYLKRNHFTLAQYSKYMALPVLFLVASTIFTGIRWDKGYDKIPEYGGYLISLWDVHSEKKTVHLNSKEDSLIYHVITDLHFFSDPVHINAAYFEKIGVPFTDKKIQSLSVILSNNIDYKRKFKEQGLYYIDEHAGLVLFLFTVAMLAIFSSANGKIRIKNWVVLLLAGYLLLYFFIAVFLKMEERIFGPMAISFCTIFALLIETDNTSIVKTRPLFALWFLLLLFFTGIELVSFEKRFRARKEEVAYIGSIFEGLGARSEKYQFIDQISDQIYLYPFQKDPLRKDKFYPTIDNYGFFVCPTFDDKMQSITGANNTKGYLEFLASHPDDCIVVSEQTRLDELLKYFNYMYHLNLRCYPVIRDLRQTYKGEKHNLPQFGLFKVTF